eukprot:gene8969-1303_t
MALKRLLSVVEEKLAPHIAMCEADSDMERIYSQKEVLLLSRSKNTKMTQNALHPSPQLTAAQLARHAPETVPRFRTSRLQRNAERREQQRTNDNTGYKWFNLPAVKMTDAVKSELKLLKLRNTLDQKHFFKRDDHSQLPKYFQMGRLENSAAEFYSDRTTKRSKKITLVDSLLRDAKRRKERRHRFGKIIAAKQNRTRKSLWRKKSKNHSKEKLYLVWSSREEGCARREKKGVLVKRRRVCSSREEGCARREKKGYRLGYLLATMEQQHRTGCSLDVLKSASRTLTGRQATSRQVPNGQPCYLLTTISATDGIDLLVSSENARLVLTKKCFLKQSLLDHAKALGCAVTAKSDKGEIIEVLIKHWEDTCTQNTSIRSYPTTSPEKTSVSVQMVSDIPYSPPQVPVQDYTLAVPDANNLASMFCDVFYGSFVPLSFTTDLFFEDAEFQLIVEPGGGNEFHRGAANIIHRLIRLPKDDNIILQHTADTIWGRQDEYGILAVEAKGTVHNPGKVIGRFVKQCLLAQDPFLQNTWRIRNMKIECRLH